MPLIEVVENLKLSLVGHLTETFDVHVKCPCSRSEIVKLSLVGLCQTFDVHVKCPLFPSVVIIMLSLRVGKFCTMIQLYPSRNLPEYTIVLRHERNDYDLVALCSARTIDMHLRLFVLSVLALA